MLPEVRNNAETLYNIVVINFYIQTFFLTVVPVIQCKVGVTDQIMYTYVGNFLRIDYTSFKFGMAKFPHIPTFKKMETNIFSKMTAK